MRSLYPSLYLSLASDHAKLGDRTAARHELGRARGLLGELGDDAYSDRVRGAVARLEERLQDGRPA
ncbi:hypothetical protein [Streptomyces sp. NPDC048172]|uniref:hypothetical protein n=1 Tax=Streptomyces sp. NPDC048172 TaxID=3365505 RepID=UPI00371E9760